jgi:hypothetical protein
LNISEIKRTNKPTERNHIIWVFHNFCCLAFSSKNKITKYSESFGLGNFQHRSQSKLNEKILEKSIGHAYFIFPNLFEFSLKLIFMRIFLWKEKSVDPSKGILIIQKFQDFTKALYYSNVMKKYLKCFNHSIHC